MNPNGLTAAHHSLPFGTKVLVKNLSKGGSYGLSKSPRLL